MAYKYDAYLDESGTHGNSESVVVAGFISSPTKWVSFSKEWKGALDDWGIPMFHMTEFENRQGCFETWNDEQRQTRLNILLDIIKRHTFRSIAYIIRKQAFDDIVSDQVKDFCADAYGFATFGCWHRLSELARLPHNNGYIRYIMDHGCRGGNKLLKIYQAGSEDPEWVENNRIIGISFENKRFFLPLQAADIIAYEIFKHAKRQFFGDKHKPRYPFKELDIPNRRDWHYADDDALRRENEYISNLLNKYYPINLTDSS